LGWGRGRFVTEYSMKQGGSWKILSNLRNGNAVVTTHCKNQGKGKSFKNARVRVVHRCQWNVGPMVGFRISWEEGEQNSGQRKNKGGV